MFTGFSEYWLQRSSIRIVADLHSLTFQINTDLFLYLLTFILAIKPLLFLYIVGRSIFIFPFF